MTSEISLSVNVVEFRIHIRIIFLNVQFLVKLQFVVCTNDKLLSNL